MANTLCFTHVNSFKSSKPGFLIGGSNAQKVIRIDTDIFRSSQTAKPHSVVVKATDTENPTPTPKPKVSSIVCASCEGNGAVVCSQCKGDGVNSVDHFNGRFKAGAICWLCRGKRDILCGSCNGAGFTGGFMSTFDE